MEQKSGLDFIRTLFTKNDGSQVIVQEAPKRVYYKREEDPDLEVMSQLEEKVSNCGVQIERANLSLSPIEKEIRSLSLQKKSLVNKTGAEGVAISTKAAKLMIERDKLKKRVIFHEQTRYTLSTQLENYRNIKEAEETSILMAKATGRIRDAVSTLDLKSVSDAARDTRMVSDKATKVIDLIIDPHGVTTTDVTNSYMSEFDALDYSDEFLSEEQQIAVPNTVVRQNITNKQNNPVVAVLEDELF